MGCPEGIGEAAAKVKNLLDGIRFTAEKERARIRIPVCYGGDYGPDLQEVADYHHMTSEEVGENPYRRGLSGVYDRVRARVSLCRRSASCNRHTTEKKPRLVIPAGSVGIAGFPDRGAYPQTPGGWQLIGRTPPCSVPALGSGPSSLLQAGDRLEFYSITPKEYEAMAAKEKEGLKQMKIQVKKRRPFDHVTGSGTVWVPEIRRPGQWRHGSVQPEAGQYPGGQ